MFPRALAAVSLVAALAISGCGGGSASRAAGGAGNRVPQTRTATAPSFASVRVSVPAANSGGAFTAARDLTIPRGWSVEVWARVAGARFMTWTPQGALLVSAPYSNEVVELTPGPNRAAPPAQRILLRGLDMPQGMAFDRVGGQTVLYVAEADRIDRYLWRGTAGVGTRTVIVRDLPDLDRRGDDDHELKSLVVGGDHRIYVSIGSAFNASAEDIAGSPPRASVVSYDDGGGDMKVIATGVRNGEGLSFAPDGVLWSAVNERDNTPYPFHGSYDGVADAFGKVIQSYVNDHPPDEIVALTPGRNVGWPYCDPDPAKGLTNLTWDDDATTNAGGKALDCSRLAPVNVGLPAHSAPLGFHFLEGSTLPDGLTGGAIVAVHGSWDRQPPQPPAVLWMPWNAATRTLGSAITLVSGFQSANGSRWGRPVDAIPGADGSLYVSDDTANAVYRLTP